MLTVKTIFLVAISCSFGVGRITEQDTRVGREMVFGEGATAIETWKIKKEKPFEVCLDVMITPVQFAATAPLVYFIIRRIPSFINCLVFSRVLYFRSSVFTSSYVAKTFMAKLKCIMNIYQRRLRQ